MEIKSWKQRELEGGTQTGEIGITYSSPLYPFSGEVRISDELCLVMQTGCLWTSLLSQENHIAVSS